MVPFALSVTIHVPNKIRYEIEFFMPTFRKDQISLRVLSPAGWYKLSKNIVHILLYNAAYVG